MLGKFQIDPIYRSGEMAKTSFDPVKIQQQQLEGVDLNVKPTPTAWIRPEDTCTRKNNHELVAKPSCNHRNQSCSK